MCSIIPDRRTEASTGAPLARVRRRRSLSKLGSQGRRDPRQAHRQGHRARAPQHGQRPRGLAFPSPWKPHRAPPHRAGIPGRRRIPSSTYRAGRRAAGKHVPAVGEPQASTCPRPARPRARSFVQSAIRARARAQTRIAAQKIVLADPPLTRTGPRPAPAKVPGRCPCTPGRTPHQGRSTGPTTKRRSGESPSQRHQRPTDGPSQRPDDRAQPETHGRFSRTASAGRRRHAPQAPEAAFAHPQHLALGARGWDVVLPRSEWLLGERDGALVD